MLEEKQAVGNLDKPAAIAMDFMMFNGNILFVMTEEHGLFSR